MLSQSSFPLMVPCRSNSDSHCVNYLCHFIFFFFFFLWAVFPSFDLFIFLTRHGRGKVVNKKKCFEINCMHVRTSMFPLLCFFLIEITSHTRFICLFKITYLYTSIYLVLVCSKCNILLLVLVCGIIHTYRSN